VHGAFASGVREAQALLPLLQSQGQGPGGPEGSRVGFA
jgi:hypothetical protein